MTQVSFASAMRSEIPIYLDQIQIGAKVKLIGFGRARYRRCEHGPAVRYFRRFARPSVRGILYICPVFPP